MNAAIPMQKGKAPVWISGAETRKKRDSFQRLREGGLMKVFKQSIK